MRIDGFSSHSYPVKRKPRKGNVLIDDSSEALEGEFQARAETQAHSSGATIERLPTRQQDMIFPRSMSKRAATALASYLTTAGFVECDMEVLGLDLHI